MTDVCPYTLGVDTLNRWGIPQESGYFAPVIERNRSIPLVAFVPLHGNTINKQRLILKSTVVKAGWWLIIFSFAELSVNVPPKPAGDVRIDVRFTYDINGILDVDISVPLTGAKK